MLCVDTQSSSESYGKRLKIEPIYEVKRQHLFDSVPFGYPALHSYISSSVQHFSLVITESYSSVRVCDIQTSADGRPGCYLGLEQPWPWMRVSVVVYGLFSLYEERCPLDEIVFLFFPLETSSHWWLVNCSSLNSHPRWVRSHCSPSSSMGFEVFRLAQQALHLVTCILALHLFHCFIIKR